MGYVYVNEEDLDDGSDGWEQEIDPLNGLPSCLFLQYYVKLGITPSILFTLKADTRILRTVESLS